MLSRKQVGNPDDYFDKNFEEYRAGFESRGRNTSKLSGYYGRRFDFFPQANPGLVWKSFTSLPLPEATAFTSPSKTSTTRLIWLSMISFRFSFNTDWHWWWWWSWSTVRLGQEMDMSWLWEGSMTLFPPLETLWHLVVARVIMGWSSPPSRGFILEKNNGPEGWVHIPSSYTNLDQIQYLDQASTSKSQPNISISTKLKHQNLDYPSFRISTKIKLNNLYQTSTAKKLTKIQLQNLAETSTYILTKPCAQHCCLAPIDIANLWSPFNRINRINH